MTTAIERAEAALDSVAGRVKFVEVCPTCQFPVTDLHEGHWDDCPVPALSALVEEAKAREREIERLQEAGSMLYTLLFRAWLFKGYSNGPLMEPATEMGMKDWLAAQSEQGDGNV
jgi:hypothetical protein